MNPDLIERIEATPDTVITLTNGTKHVVEETLDEIVARVQLFKATTLALAADLARDGSAGQTRLRVVPGPDDELGTDPDS